MIKIVTELHEWQGQGYCRYQSDGVFQPVLDDDQGGFVAPVKQGTFYCKSLRTNRTNSSTTSTESEQLL